MIAVVITYEYHRYKLLRLALERDDKTEAH